MTKDLYPELERQLLDYIEEKKLNKSEGRFVMLRCICDFKKHFGLEALGKKMEEHHYSVSRATLYNTMNTFLEAELVVRHAMLSKDKEYELKALAFSHYHLICSVCGKVVEVKNDRIQEVITKTRFPRFTTHYHELYIYGLCSKCKYKIARNKKKENINEKLKNKKK